MKILFIGSGCACRLPFVEYLFKKKIPEAEVPDIEVESADMAMWGVTSNESGIPKSSGPDKVGNLLNQADFIVVMEGRQRNFLTRFMDYSSWNKIHLFLDYCTSGKEHLVGSVCGDLDYQTQDEEMTNGCMNLIARIKAFLKEHLGEKTEISTLITA